MNLILATISVFLINIPFGYWRAQNKKMSFKWFMAIHIPIPLVILFRFLFKLGFKFYTYPFIVGAFFLGQLFGSKLYNIRLKMREKNSE
jgi:hypothetical protein